MVGKSGDCMSRKNFIAEEMNFKGAYNANRHRNKACMEMVKKSSFERIEKTMDLKNVSTKKLVEELASREAVERITVEPYEEYSITVGDQKISDSGPVVILRIWD